jgi:predicted CxxxxCH...CXXCH cytochrome family protein
MNVLIRGIILTVLLVALGAPCALAIEPPHDATNAISCANCHYAGATINSVGFTNFCNSCHRPGGMAQLHPFSPNDASNIFNNVTSKRTGLIMQTSHNWGGGLDVPKAGAVTPAATSPLSYAPLVGLSCDRCHSLHGTIQSATNSFPFLRTLKERDQICFECHSPRKTTNQTTGSHPVTMTYTTAIKKFARYTTKFYTTPVNANPANSSSAMRLNGGQVLCSTCHGMHFSDSNSATFDNASSVVLGRLTPGDGFLLRTDLHGATPNTTNICTNCHKGKVAHNVKNQNIQCADCHAGHVDEADGTKPNVWLVRRYMSYSTGTYKLNNRLANKPTFFQSTTVKNYRDANSTGVCQACHALPTTVSEHSQPNVNCNLCHYHDNPKGSFAVTSCTACHGYPPKANVLGGPTGYAAGYTRADESKSPHSTHDGIYAFSCDNCHKGNNHNTGTYSDVFLSPSGTLAASDGATPTYTAGSFTCSATYCHSDGAPRTAGLLNGSLTSASVVWLNGKGTFTTSATHCQKCHGDASTLNTNAHAKHVSPTSGRGFNCGICHSQTVAFTNSTSILTKSLHVNNVKEISFAGQGAGSTFNAAVGVATCATSCHSDGKGSSPITVPAWTSAASGACGTCHNATAPLIGSNGHPAHFTAAYGPKFAASAGSCASCHNYTTEIAATHVNGTVDTPVSNCTTNCHRNGINTSTNWTAGRVSCESCHTGSLSVIGVTAPDKSLSVSKGHTQATFTGTPSCNSCHNPDSNHITGTLGTNPRLTLTNDNSQCASCHNVAGKTIARFQNMSTHFTVKGGAQDMLCRQCHDPHGTTNLSMIKTQMKGTWTNATTYTITYTDAVNGFINTTNNRGLCQVCHTKTNHYRAGVAESGHPVSGCLNCHSHRGAGGAFKPKGTCDACHGYPPAPRDVANLAFGTAGNYLNAGYENYSGGGGAHMIPSHVSPSVTADQGWVNCVRCHNGGNASHKALTPMNVNIANVTIAVDAKYKFNAAKQMTYSGARFVYPGNKTGQCTNVECHFQPSQKWSLGITNPLAPTITNLSPTSMVAGSTQNLTIIGTNLAGATVTISGTGITLGTATLAATQITVPVTISAVAGAGTRTVTVTNANGYTNAQLTITAKAIPTITWPTPASVIMGTALSATQLNATASVPGSFVYTPAAGTVMNTAGTQTLSVTFTPTDSVNYSTATATVSLIVTAKAIPTITWGTPAAITYGTALSASQLNAIASVPGSFVYTPAAGTILGAGTQTLTTTFTPTDTVNYATTSASVSIIVNKAVATVTLSGLSQTYNGTARSATITTTPAGLATTVTYNFVATVPVTAGSYEVVATVTDPNYTGNSLGTMTIAKATPTITWGTPAAVLVGTTLSGTQLNATASVPGSFVYTPSAGTVLGTAGTQTLSTTFTPTDAVNYTTASASVSLTVSAKVVPSITWATPAAITYGTALSGTQLNATASVPGSFTYLPAAGTVLSAGTQTLSATFTPTDTVAYASTTASVSLTVNRATPVVSWATPANVTVGTALSATQLNATASVAGTFAYTPVAGTVLSTVGIQTLSVTFTPSDSLNYTTAGATVSLNVIASATLTNVALAANGGVATASSTINANYPVSSINNGDRIGAKWGTGGGWNDATNNAYPDWVQITFNAQKSISEIDVFTVQDALTAAVTPTAAMIFTKYGITAFDVQYWNGTAWVTVPGGSITGNNLVWRTITLATPVTTNMIRVQVNAALGGYSRLVEVEAYGTAAGGTTPTTPTITWANPAAITYGTALSATQLNATASVPGTFLYSPVAGTVLAAGTQTLTVTFTPNDTVAYTSASKTASIVVNKATPTITWANPASVVIGTTLSTTQLNATASVAGSFVYTPAIGTVMSTAGTQTLSVTFTPNDTANYTTATATASLLVTSKTVPTITWSNPAAITYGTALSTTQLNATASVAGTFVYTPAVGAVLNAGTQILSVTFSPTDTVNYTTATASVSLTVNKVTPSITWATPAAVSAGTTLSTTQLNATASVAGVFVYTPIAGTVMSTAGTQILSATFTPTDTVNYTTATATVSLIVNAAAARTNVALSTNGGVATASSTYNASYPITAINNGDRIGATWGTGGGWNDATNNVYPDWAQITFNGQKTIDEIDVFTVQDALTAAVVPTASMTFTKYGVTSFVVQYWNGTAWVAVPGGTITGNTLVWRTISLATPITTNMIRVQVNASLGGYSRLVELEAYGY